MGTVLVDGREVRCQAVVKRDPRFTFSGLARRTEASRDVLPALSETDHGDQRLADAEASGQLDATEAGRADKSDVGLSEFRCVHALASRDSVRLGFGSVRQAARSRAVDVLVSRVLGVGAPRQVVDSVVGSGPVREVPGNSSGWSGSDKRLEHKVVDEPIHAALSLPQTDPQVAALQHTRTKQSGLSSGVPVRAVLPPTSHRSEVADLVTWVPHNRQPNLVHTMHFTTRRGHGHCSG
jgi:hypothetical protein